MNKEETPRRDRKERNIRGQKHENSKRPQKESCKCIINKRSLLIVLSTCAETHTYTIQRGSAWGSAGLDYKQVLINAEGLRL